jgi:hypothetical protein
MGIQSRPADKCSALKLASMVEISARSEAERLDGWTDAQDVHRGW